MPFKDYRVTSNYGWRHHPIRNRRLFHAGIDLVKRKGGVNAPIEAFIGGEVLYAGNGRSGTGVGGYGNVVVIRDGKGKAHVYAHLHSLSVRKGQNVSKGQVIGRQGATGQVTGAHLHYEVRKKSSPSLGWTNDQQNTTHNPTDYVKNYNLIAVDGFWGPETTRALQKHFKTIQDGVISGQPRNSSTLNIPSAKFGNGGSLLIRAMQRHYKSGVVDGVIGGQKTGKSMLITKMQETYKTIVDGKVSKPSVLVREVQRRLNNGTL